MDWVGSFAAITSAMDRRNSSRGSCVRRSSASSTTHARPPAAGCRGRAARRRARPARGAAPGPGPAAARPRPSRRRSWTAAAPGPSRARAWTGRAGADAAAAGGAAPAPRPRTSTTPTRTRSAATRRSTARGTCHSCAESSPPPRPGSCCRLRRSCAPCSGPRRAAWLISASPPLAALLLRSLLRHARARVVGERACSGSKQLAVKQQAVRSSSRGVR